MKSKISLVLLSVLLLVFLGACSSKQEEASQIKKVEAKEEGPVKKDEKNTADAKESIAMELFSPVPDDSIKIQILNYENNLLLKNLKSYTYADEDQELPIHLKDGDAKISFGKDHPNGIRIRLLKDNVGVPVELEQVQDGILDDYGDLADIDNDSITVGTYDFNNDSNEEIIIAIGDELEGQMWVYSYHEVDDLTKINPFHLEMTEYCQGKVWLDGNKIMLPYGSQGLFEEYGWYDGGFLHKEN